MLQKDNRTKLLSVFMDDPLRKEGFQLRELSRTIDVAPPSIKRYLNEFEKEHFIQKRIIRGYPVYFANRDSDYFTFLKKLHTLAQLYESTLINYLNDNCMPDVIILFGSASRGEDVKESDIDVFVSSKKVALNLAAYEKAIGRTINILFEPHFNKLSSELKNNILNGIPLKGYLKVF